ncbi:hypothetical protein IED13_01125 [Bosea sp. SSUT16]|uniref:Uncharacterized protein n=1 Tax=Bosea spartocytisi TaxID=2773451 RepID=A0A927E3S7_9HYPH|nr:hypothetical protein [Bosea spartocytisi]MBD3844281.1 hypothetical protein [Bosea spartocytisi]MCT4470613.1 hypothetical protein [Bosea spartocytisi]
MAEMIKVIITKYALSTGLIVADAEKDASSDMVVVRQENGFPSYYHGKHWTTDPAEALKRAEEMRGSKIASVEKHLAKLRKLRFAIPEINPAKENDHG